MEQRLLVASFSRGSGVLQKPKRRSFLSPKIAAAIDLLQFMPVAVKILFLALVFGCWPGAPQIPPGPLGRAYPSVNGPGNCTTGYKLSGGQAPFKWLECH